MHRRGRCSAWRKPVAAKASGADQVATVERALGWERLKTLVAEADKIVAGTREDNLSEIVDRYPTVRRMVPVLLGAFVFRSWKSDDPLLAALDVLRGVHAAGQRNLPPRPPMAFLKPAWRKLVGTGATLDRRAYEVAVMMMLRDRLRSGDIWVEGSRAFRAFDDFLLPPETFAARRQENELGLAVSNVFDDWRTGESVVFKPDFEKSMRSPRPANSPKLSSPQKAFRSVRSARTRPMSRDHRAPALWNVAAPAHHRASRRSARLDRVRGSVLSSANGGGGRGQLSFDDGAARRRHQSRACRMARSSKVFSHSKLLGLPNGTSATKPIGWSRLFGRCDSRAALHENLGRRRHASSDGQFFKAGGHGEARADYNAKYGSEPGVKFYTHVSDRYAPFHTKVIAANASEAAHILDGLLHHECSLDIREHYTDTAGAIDHVFGLCHLLGFRFAPPSATSPIAGSMSPTIAPRIPPWTRMIGGTVDFHVIGENWDETLRLAASIKAGPSRRRH